MDLDAHSGSAFFQSILIKFRLTWEQDHGSRPWDQDVFSLVGAMLPECLRKIGQKWINIYFIEHFGANSGSPAKSLLTGDGPRQTCTHPYDT